MYVFWPIVLSYANMSTTCMFKTQENGGMQILRQLLARPCKQVEAQMYLMLIPLMVSQGPCTTALPKVSN